VGVGPPRLSTTDARVFSSSGDPKAHAFTVHTLLDDHDLGYYVKLTVFVSVDQLPLTDRAAEVWDSLPSSP